MSSAIVPTYARADLTFERGDGCWLTTTTASAISISAPASPSSRSAIRIPISSRRWRRRAPSSGTPRTCSRCPRASGSPGGSPTRPSPISSSSPIPAPRPTRPRSRWRGGAQYVGGHGERYRILTFEGAFHGRTLATIAAGGQAKYLEGFGPKVDGFDQIPITDLAAVEAAIVPETAAIMIEPIQGEGGVRVVPPAFLRGLREICDRHGLLLIFDEVQTGVGRTGKLFAYEHVGVAPDILTTAKGIGGGFPIAACLATADAARGPHRRRARHDLRRQSAGDGDRQRRARRRAGAGLPRQCRAARPRSPSRSSPRSTTRIPTVIEEVRGEGLMLGLKLKMPPGDFAALAREQHMLTIPAGDNTLRLLPPLTVTDAELDEARAPARRGLRRARRRTLAKAAA